MEGEEIGVRKREGVSVQYEKSGNGNE